MRSASLTALAALLLAAASAPWASGDTGGGSGGAERVSVIVQGSEGIEDARRGVRSVGGTVRFSLPIVDGVSASVPKQAVETLRSDERVVNVSLDERVSFDGEMNRYAGPAPSIPAIVNASKLWKEGITGRGVTIALLDTGVYAAHPDLQGATGSRVIHCEDLSHERMTEAHCADTFGHGTFMAGLMAGSGIASGGKFMGTAPRTKIVSVKVAGFDGSTDISHILAGIQWIVAHKDSYDIRVLNLSLGSDSAQDYRLSPLNLAVERAWQAGIVALVSAGNSGDDPRTVHKPGDDPYVVTVGASNDEGSRAISDDRIPAFSSRGPTKANGFVKPDVVAPGVKTVSLRSPGSSIDQEFGSTAVVEDEYFRGTGTSMATAVTSGVVALILDKRPNLVPDQVKFRLKMTARRIADTNPNAAGKGLIDAYTAASTTRRGRANQDIDDLSNGLGRLQSDRGSVRVEVATPLAWVELGGEFVAQIDPLNPVGLVPWVGLQYATTGWDPATWNLTTWATNEWPPTAWDGTQWRATVWDGTQWRGTQWRNEDWEGTQWRGTQWRHEDWDGTQWRATTWQSKWYAAAWN